jgi:putative membrane protein insertion efficiency factor
MKLSEMELKSKKIVLLLINFYRATLSHFFGGNCRFLPSCSQYALDCFDEHSFFKASQLTLIRVCKCRPGGPHGWDPAPKREKANE